MSPTLETGHHLSHLLSLPLLLSEDSWCEGGDECIRAGTVAHACKPALERMRLKRLEASLGCIVRRCLKINRAKPEESIRQRANYRPSDSSFQKEKLSQAFTPPLKNEDYELASRGNQ